MKVTTNAQPLQIIIGIGLSVYYFQHSWHLDFHEFDQFIHMLQIKKYFFVLSRLRLELNDIHHNQLSQITVMLQKKKKRFPSYTHDTYSSSTPTDYNNHNYD